MTTKQTKASLFNERSIGIPPPPPAKAPNQTSLNLHGVFTGWLQIKKYIKLYLVFGTVDETRASEGEEESEGRQSVITNANKQTECSPEVFYKWHPFCSLL